MQRALHSCPVLHTYWHIHSTPQSADWYIFDEGKVREILESQNRQKTQFFYPESMDCLGHSLAFLQPGSSLVQINICWCIISWSRLVFSIARLSFNKMTKHDFIRQTNEIKPSRRLLEMFLFFFLNSNTGLSVKWPDSFMCSFLFSMAVREGIWACSVWTQAHHDLLKSLFQNKERLK